MEIRQFKEQNETKNIEIQSLAQQRDQFAR
jgi:FtsZ-binding cell division protein ZapB